MSAVHNDCRTLRLTVLKIEGDTGVPCTVPKRQSLTGMSLIPACVAGGSGAMIHPCMTPGMEETSGFQHDVGLQYMSSKLWAIPQLC